MLAPPDADLAERDPEVPGLAAVLDPERFCEAAAGALPELGITAAQPVYVRYKPATNCLVGYRFATATGEVTGYAKAFRAGDDAKLAKTLHLDDHGRVAVLEATGVGLQLFPVDRTLRSLWRLGDPTQRRRLLRRALPDRPDLWAAELTPLRYKPERRWVGRLDGTEGAALVKCHSRHAHRRALAGAAVHTAIAGVRGVRRLGSAADHGVLVLEWLPGRPLDAGLATGLAGTCDVLAAGRALAALHGGASDGARVGLPRLTTGDRCHALRTSADAVAAVLPCQSAMATELATRCAAVLQGLSPLVATVHGDFSADQVLVADDGVALIDLDSAAIGDPTYDLGSFAASLDEAVVCGDLGEALAAEAREALIEGHGRLGGADGRTRLVAAHAEALLRRAVEPFRRRSPDWPAATAALVARGAAVLAELR